MHVLFAGERVRKEYTQPAPEITEIARPGEFAVLTLEALVRMKLTSNRRKDQVHIEDLIDVVIDQDAWLYCVPVK